METSKGMLWTGRILSGLAVLFMVMDGVMKLVRPQPVIEAMAKLGLPDSSTTFIGILALTCTAIYVVPRTSVLGAVLLTGYLGGAIATHVRAGSDAFSHIFPIIIGLMFWGGLWLRDEKLRALIPFKI